MGSQITCTLSLAWQARFSKRSQGVGMNIILGLLDTDQAQFGFPEKGGHQCQHPQHYPRMRPFGEP